MYNLGYPACIAYTPFCYLWPATIRKIFTHYPIKGKIFKKYLLYTKRVFWFSLQLLSETFLILGTIETCGFVCLCVCVFVCMCVYVCVCVYNVGYPACIAYTPFCYLWYAPIRKNFTHYPIKGTVFKKIYYIQNVCLGFLYNFCLKHFLF